ncbi:MAG TPA: hypothetical protein VEL76_16265 [Gemmataceae bacterium]|nr:hypothetical protein [Gemmataceae bacterium]
MPLPRPGDQQGDHTEHQPKTGADQSSHQTDRWNDPKEQADTAEGNRGDAKPELQAAAGARWPTLGRAPLRQHFVPFVVLDQNRSRTLSSCR